MVEPNPDAAARKKEREREYQHQWYLKNREKVLEQGRQRRSDPAKRAMDRDYQRKWAQENPDKVRATRRRWREANPDKVRGQQAKSRDYQRRYYETNRAKWREQQRKRNYGMDSATFVTMWEAQERCCYLCIRSLSAEEAAVDHWHGCTAHAPNKGCRSCWRGLTHPACNAAAGQANDDPGLLRVIADNLEAANIEVMKRQQDAPEQLRLL